jgi:acyl dehydratase
MLAFARQFDPQPFHADAAAAGETVFGGLIASGWHTCAVGMRLMVQSYLGRAVSLGSPGIDSIRWLKPVRPGDTLLYRRTVVESRASATRKDVGLVKHRWEAVNQAGELVLTMEGWGLFGRKN